VRPVARTEKYHPGTRMGQSGSPDTVHLPRAPAETQVAADGVSVERQGFPRFALATSASSLTHIRAWLRPGRG
jgi:hypothetical protein